MLRRSLVAAAGVFALVAAGPPPSRGELDIGRLVAGRTMYAAGTWALDSFYSYRTRRLVDPGGDTAGANFELERGQAGRFGWEAGLSTTRSSRNRLQLGRAGVGLRGLAIESPFELALAGEWEPSLRDGPPEWGLEAEALANFGDRFSAVLQVSTEVEPGSNWEHQFIAGPILRFGLQGLAGLQGVYASDGAVSLQAVVGGAVSRRVFVSVTPRAGINARAPDAALMVELHALFGPYPFGAWGLR